MWKQKVELWMVEELNAGGTSAVSLRAKAEADGTFPPGGYNTWGNLIMQWARKGKIRKSDALTQAPRRAHGRRVPIWVWKTNDNACPPVTSV